MWREFLSRRRKLLLIVRRRARRFRRRLAVLLLPGLPRRPQAGRARRGRGARPPRPQRQGVRRPRPRRRRARQAVRPSETRGGSVHRRRGPALPRSRRGGPAARPRRAVEQRALGRGRGGVEHHHDAARPQRLPRRAARPEADAGPQDPRGPRRPRDRRRVHQGPDPGDVPQPHLLRERRHGDRGRGAPLLRPPGQQADPAPGRAARGAAQGPHPLRSAAATRSRPGSAATSCSP